MLEYLFNDVIVGGKECIGYDEVGDEVIVWFVDGILEMVDMLIGVDGINFVVLWQVFGDLEIFYIGLWVIFVWCEDFGGIDWFVGVIYYLCNV